MLDVPVTRLLDPGRRFVESREILGGVTDVPYFDIQGHHVWGATAMILAEFAAVVAGLAGTEDR
jgi:hypothetical protein